MSNTDSLYKGIKEKIYNISVAGIEWTSETAIPGSYESAKWGAETAFSISVELLKWGAGTAIPAIYESVKWGAETAIPAIYESVKWGAETAISASYESAKWVAETLKWGAETAISASYESAKWVAHSIMNGAVMALQSSGPLSIAVGVIRARNKIVQTMKIFELNQFAKLLSKAGVQLQGAVNQYQQGVDRKKAYLDKLVQSNQDVQEKSLKKCLKQYTAEQQKKYLNIFQI